MRKVLVVLAILILLGSAGATDARAQIEEGFEGASFQRVRWSFFSNGVYHRLDTDRRDGTLPFHLGFSTDLELGLCPALAFSLSGSLMDLWVLNLASMSVGIKLRFPLNLDGDSWFAFGGAPGIQGLAPYLKVKAGICYSGTYGDPTALGWLEHTKERKIYPVGGAFGFETRISSHAFLYLEGEFFSFLANNELPVNFLGVNAGISYAF
jgi:hypothetical protein